MKIKLIKKYTVGLTETELHYLSIALRDSLNTNINDTVALKAEHRVAVRNNTETLINIIKELGSTVSA